LIQSSRVIVFLSAILRSTLSWCLTSWKRKMDGKKAVSHELKTPTTKATATPPTPTQ
jgi:hypothetical protein